MPARWKATRVGPRRLRLPLALPQKLAKPNSSRSHFGLTGRSTAPCISRCGAFMVLGWGCAVARGAGDAGGGAFGQSVGVCTASFACRQSSREVSDSQPSLFGIELASSIRPMANR